MEAIHFFFSVCGEAFFRRLFVSIVFRDGDIDVVIDMPDDVVWLPSFPFDVGVEPREIAEVKIHFPFHSFQGVIVRKPVDQFFHELNSFKLAQRFQILFAQNPSLFLDHFIAEGMEGVDVYFIRVTAKKTGEALTHGHGAGVSERKAEDILWLSVGFQQDLGDAEGEDLCFPCSGSGDHHYRTFDGFNRFFLAAVQLGVFFFVGRQ